MARKRANGTKNSSDGQRPSGKPPNAAQAKTRIPAAGSAAELFGHVAQATARLAGKPIAFLTAVAAVVIWALTGPLFNYSDTWQLVINTSTTIITFLMVFLIQHTQNRDQMALQIKLAELIVAMRGAHNSLATAEDMTEEELERLHEEFRCRADVTLETLEARRADKTKT